MNNNDIALDIILQHTASAEWEDVVDMNWTTAETINKSTAASERGKYEERKSLTYTYC